MKLSAGVMQQTLNSARDLLAELYIHPTILAPMCDPVSNLKKRLRGRRCLSTSFSTTCGMAGARPQSAPIHREPAMAFLSPRSRIESGIRPEAFTMSSPFRAKAEG
jgi:hypothetical protein